MRIGIGPGELERRYADPAAARLGAAAAEGRFSSFWLPQGTGFDAMTVLAQVAAIAPSVELGVAVVPIQFQHPASLAARALTVNGAIGGRLTLGIGVAHRFVVESRGLTFDRPVAYMEEYLKVLSPLLHQRVVDFRGERVAASMALDIPMSVPAPQLIVAALGSRMLRLAGSLAEGTILWLTGLRTVANHTIPTIMEAARQAGRSSPRVIVSLPICVSNDSTSARSLAQSIYGHFGEMPSYRAMLDREGAARPADVAIVGDERAVAAQLTRLADTGVTDFHARVFGAPEDCARTLDLLSSISSPDASRYEVRNEVEGSTDKEDI